MDLSMLVAVIAVIFLVIFLIMFIMIFLSFLRWFRGPRAYYPPIKVEDYMCPRCGSKELDIIGIRTLRCRKCGTTFTLRTAAYEGRWIIWPFFWWFPIIIPIPIRNK
ncbi:MAG: hypothetical protein QW424_03995 [Candidatus Bathyarchaeia archaeon]